MPSNPNMRNEKLCAVFESLGFKNVQAIISSGNVIFDTDSAHVTELENMVEKALLEQLGIKSPAYIRSKGDLEKLIKKDPFKGSHHSKTSYLLVSFRKEKPREIFTSIDTTHASSTKFMSDLDKKYGKAVTSRTWMTVERILAKMNDNRSTKI